MLLHLPMYVSMSLRHRRKTLNAQSLLFFFFNDTATTEIYTLSLHDALPICPRRRWPRRRRSGFSCSRRSRACRSEEHTSELQSRRDLVCRLLLEKKKKKISTISI